MDTVAPALQAPAAAAPTPVAPRAVGNPWPGLATFTESAQQSFHGREEETDELLRRVSNARLTVLFGKSGLGKSSLILAGLFPRLRAANVLPVYLRLQVRTDRLPLVDQMRDALLEQIEAQDVDAPPIGGDEGLWDYLHRRDLELWSTTNHLLTPLFALDQFEELFTHGEQIPGAVSEFRSDFGNLAENGIPKSLAIRIERQPELSDRLDVRAWRYGVLVSLREDFLPHLESWRRAVASLGGNRMRLLPMRRRQAFAAVYDTAPRLDPSGQVRLVSESLAWKIVNHVSAASLKHMMSPVRPLSEKETQYLYSSLTESSPSIEPALLSLFCAGLYQRRCQESGGAASIKPFDDELLEGTKEAIIEDFYRDSIKDLPDRVAEFIEMELITERGFRDSYPKEDAIKKGVVTEAELQVLVDRRLLRLEQHYGIPRIELTHDILTRAVCEERNRRQADIERAALRARAADEKRKAEEAQRELQHYKVNQERHELLDRTRRQQRLIVVAAAAAVVFLGIGALAIWKWLQADEEFHRAISAKLALQAANMRERRAQGNLATSLRLSIASFREFAGDEGQRALRQGQEASRGITAALDFPRAPSALAYSPDGAILAVAKRDSRIELLDAKTHERIGAELVGHSDPIRQLAFSPDGSTLASASFDGSAILWDTVRHAARGQPLRHKDSVTCVAFSPDGKLVATGGLDRYIKFWDPASGAERGPALQGLTDGLVSLAFSPDGKWLASGGRDGKVDLWNVASRTGQNTLYEVTAATVAEPIFSIAFSPDGKWLAWTGRGKRVLVYDLAAEKISPVILIQKETVRAIAFSPDSKTLATADAGGEIVLWDVASGERALATLSGHQDSVTAISFAPPDGRTLASVSRDRSLLIWDLERRTPLGQTLRGHEEGVLHGMFRLDSRSLVSLDRSGAILQWEVGARAPLGASQYATRQSVRSSALTADGRIAAVTSREDRTFLWSIADATRVAELPANGRRILDMAFSQDGQMMATSDRSGAIDLWQVSPLAEAGHNPPRKIETEGVKFQSIALSPDHQILAASDSNNAVQLWRTGNGTRIFDPLQGHEDRILELAFSPDGKWLATAGRDNSVIIWDVATGSTLRAPLRGHHDAVRALAFSPDGSMLASASDDESVILWSLPAGEQLGVPLHVHSESVRDVAFSADGKWLVSAGLDKQLVLWSLERLRRDGIITRFDGGRSLDALCNKLSENIARAVWPQYAGAGVPYMNQCPDKPTP